MFTWAELPGGINTAELLIESTTNPEVKVAYIAGESFSTEGGGKGSNCMRISFGGVAPEKIRTGKDVQSLILYNKMEKSCSKYCYRTFHIGLLFYRYNYFNTVLVSVCYSAKEVSVSISE